MSHKENLLPARAYRPHQITPYSEDGGFGFHPDTGEFKAWEEIENMDEVLDSIAAAVEAGAVDRNGFVKQFFGGAKVFEEFLFELATYEQVYRIRDPWHAALSRIADRVDEEGFVTGEEIAEVLLAKARLTKQVGT